jgi:tetratricopeptide (TPR) repeat protein
MRICAAKLALIILVASTGTLRREDAALVRRVADFVTIALIAEPARELYSREVVALHSASQNDFRRLMQIDRRRALAHYHFGLAQAQSRRFVSAEREFNIALNVAPEYARARFALGTVVLREGRRAEARSDFDRVVKDANGDPALKNLALEMCDAIHDR